MTALVEFRHSAGRWASVVLVEPTFKCASAESAPSAAPMPSSLVPANVPALTTWCCPARGQIKSGRGTPTGAWGFT